MEVKNAIEAAAISYLLAYKCLMKKNKDLCDFYGDNVSIYLLPAVPIAALSCEIALKNHLNTEQRKIIRGHNLEALFLKLGEEKRNKYSQRTIELINLKSQISGIAAPEAYSKFGSLLSENKNAFTGCRYLYEGMAPADLDFLEAFMFSLNDQVEEYQEFVEFVLSRQLF